MTNIENFSGPRKPNHPQTTDSLSDKLHREGSLLESIPNFIRGGIVDRAEQLITHPGEAQFEIAASFGVAATLSFLTKDPGFLGDCARFSPKLLTGLAAVDLSRRFLAPMIDTWQHPNNLPIDEEKLGNNLGSAALDYPLAAAAGFLGGAAGAGLGRIDAIKPTSWRPTAMSDLGGIGKTSFWKFTVNAPIIYGVEHSNIGANPSFPQTVKVSNVNAFSDVSANQAVHVVGQKSLNGNHELTSFGIHVDKNEPVQLQLDAAGPGTDWGKANDESAVLSVYVDGKYSSDLVLFGGSKPAPYVTSLENLSAGNHSITLRYAKEKSSPGAQGVDILSGTANGIETNNTEKNIVNKYAPILYGRNGLDNNHTDVPMAMLYSTWHHIDGGQTIDYQYIYSNEDAGATNPPSDGMALLGRMTDIDSDLQVRLDRKGKVISETFNAPGDQFIPFNGQHEGTHPVLRVENLDDMLADYGSDALKFQYLPQYKASNAEPREEIQRENPLWWQTMAKEIAREGKVTTNGTESPPVANTAGWLGLYGKEAILGEQQKMADPRNYLYVQMDVHNGGPQSPLDAQVILKNGTKLNSDLGQESLGIAKTGWYQTAILLPPKTKVSDIKKLTFVPTGDGNATCKGVGHVYMLNQSFDPVDVTVPVDLHGT